MVGLTLGLVMRINPNHSVRAVFAPATAFVCQDLPLCGLKLSTGVFVLGPLGGRDSGAGPCQGIMPPGESAPRPG